MWEFEERGEIETRRLAGDPAPEVRRLVKAGVGAAAGDKLRPAPFFYHAALYHSANLGGATDI